MYLTGTLVRPKRLLKDPSVLLFGSPLSWKISRSARSDLEAGEFPPRSSAKYHVVRKIRFSPDVARSISAGRPVLEGTTHRLAHFNLAFRGDGNDY